MPARSGDYREALAAGADVVVMLHPDHQYTPRLVTAMGSMVAHGIYDVVLGSRILGGTALEGVMPWHKYAANHALTAFQHCFLGAKLSTASAPLPAAACWPTPARTAAP